MALLVQGQLQTEYMHARTLVEPGLTPTQGSLTDAYHLDEEVSINRLVNRNKLVAFTTDAILHMQVFWQVSNFPKLQLT